LRGEVYWINAPTTLVIAIYGEYFGADLEQSRIDHNPRATLDHPQAPIIQVFLDLIAERVPRTFRIFGVGKRALERAFRCGVSTQRVILAYCCSAFSLAAKALPYLTAGEWVDGWQPRRRAVPI
jgi:hypothetical protein